MAEHELERTLWAAADKLRSNMDTAEYKHVVPEREGTGAGKITVSIKRALKLHGYPPDKTEAAVRLVLEQAEMMAEEG